MKRMAMMLAMAILVSAGLMRATQEPVKVAPASPVNGGKVITAKTMTAMGAAKTVTAHSLTIKDGTGKDWTFVIDAATKIIPRTGQDTGLEPVNVAPASPVNGGKVIPSKPLMITDITEDQRVEVKYHTVNGKMHATQVRVM